MADDHAAWCQLSVLFFSGCQGGGEEVHIHGTGFLPGNISVTICGTPCELLDDVSPNYLKCQAQPLNGQFICIPQRYTYGKKNSKGDPHTQKKPLLNVVLFFVPHCRRILVINLKLFGGTKSIVNNDKDGVEGNKERLFNDSSVKLPKSESYYWLM